VDVIRHDHITGMRYEKPGYRQTFARETVSKAIGSSLVGLFLDHGMLVWFFRETTMKREEGIILVL